MFVFCFYQKFMNSQGIKKNCYKKNQEFVNIHFFTFSKLNHSLDFVQT